jgi:hypothetical protein
MRNLYQKLIVLAALVSTALVSVNIVGAQAAGTCSQLDAQSQPVARVGVPGEAVSDGSVGCFVIHDGTKFVQSAGSIGDIGLIRRGVKAAVEISGVTSDTSVVGFGRDIQVCLRGTGTFFYRSAVDNPRVSAPLPAVTRELEAGAYTCAIIGTTGTAILVEGSPAPAPDAVPAAVEGTVITTEDGETVVVDEEGEIIEGVDPAAVTGAATTVNGTVSLSGCRVTTRAMVRLRSEPNTDSEILARLPFQISLQSTARTGDSDWYQVIYTDQQGWVSATYLTTSAGCAN